MVPLGKSESDIIKYTTKNVTSAADIASKYGLNLFIEPLA